MTGEFAAIRRLCEVLGPQDPEAARAGEVWIGDDAAALRAPEGRWLLLAADAVVAGVHADLGLTTVEDLGWKALVGNLSDLAAMGGRPGHALVTVAGPAGTDLDGLYRGLAAAARAYACPVVGGDLTNAAALVVSVAVTGTADRPVRRDGAAAGDGIWVTGPLGASAAGLRLLRAAAADADDGGAPGGWSGQDSALVTAHARPVPLLAEGRAAAAAGASAMIDVSDGLAADLGHVADASGVGFELDDVPVAPGATAEEALTGGEDYQLVFTAPDDAPVAGAFRGLRPPRRIGRCIPGAQRRVLAGRPIEAGGWQHHW